MARTCGLVEFLSRSEPKIYPFTTPEPEAPRIHHHSVTGARHVEVDDMSPMCRLSMILKLELVLFFLFLFIYLNQTHGP